MPRTKQDMVIAVCPVAPAHAIPDQDKDGKSGAGDENWHGPTRKSPIFVRTESAGATSGSAERYSR
jgi:hypothetical protein